MKTKLCFLLLTALLSISAFGQVSQLTAPDCQFGFTFNVVSGVITSTSSTSAQRLPLSQDSSAVVGYDNRNTTCTTWTLMYQADSGLSSISLELDQAPSNGDVPGSWTSWTNPAPGTVQPLSTANVGNGSFFSYQPWVSVNFNSVSGSGRLYGRVVGWRPQAGADVTAPGNSVVTSGFTYKGISTATNTQVKSTSGVLHTVTLNGGTNGTVTIVDTSASNCSGGTTIGTLSTAATVIPTTLIFDVATTNGLCITTSAATNLTVTYR